MTKEEARREGFDFFAYHLLCNAVKAHAHYTALDYECHICVYTHTRFSQHVYFLAHKKLDRLTRKERGCFALKPEAPYKAQARQFATMYNALAQAEARPDLEEVL